jgi:glycogen(starch) synthase
VRVALLSDCYLPRLGGIEVQVHDLAAELIRAGHEVEVFTATSGPRGERRGTTQVIDGVLVHRMAIPLPYELPVNPWAPRAVRPRLVGGRFDVAHVHMGVVSPFATDMVDLCLDLNLPTAVTWHCVIDRSAPVLRALGRARRWADRGAALSGVSAMAVRHLRPVVGEDPDIGVLPNGIHVEDWVPATGGQRGSADGVVRVVTATRLVARKRPGALVSALRRVRERVGDEVSIELEVYGEGPARRRMEWLVARNGLADAVRMPGRVARSDLRARYHAADVYVAPGRLEAFGIAALEARSAGLPVVAMSGSGVEDFITDGVSGLLTGPDADLVAPLVRLASDPQLRHRIAEHNATTPPEQDWRRVVDLVVAEYVRAGAGA